MEVKTFIFLFLISNLVMASPANILVVSFFSRKSHKMTYMPLIEELGQRGHNILSPVKPFKSLLNIKEIYTLNMEEVTRGSNFFSNLHLRKRTDPAIEMMDDISEVCAKSYELPQVELILKEKFDLVFIQPLFNECLFGLIYKMKAPFALFLPHIVSTRLLNNLRGEPTPVAPEDAHFFDRFLSFGAAKLTDLYIDLVYKPRMESVYRKRLGNEIPSVTEILKNASLILANTHFSLDGSRASLPSVVEVGGLHSRKAKSLPNDLEAFIQKGKDKGFILFSMGSAISEEMMPEEKRKLILNVFSKLDQQVLWKWGSEKMEGLPSNVKLSSWLPQQDLLGHKDIKLFITHCGGGSLEEAVFHAVPILGLPMRADQPRNSEMGRKHGFLKQLNWNEITEESFLEAIMELLDNPKYRDNVRRTSELFKDRAFEPLDLAVYWVEYVLRHKGASHLKSVGTSLNFIQYHSYDVIITYVLIILCLIFMIFWLLKFAFRKIKAE